MGYAGQPSVDKSCGLTHIATDPSFEARFPDIKKPIRLTLDRQEALGP
jgi:hypothetical protein